MLATCLGLFIHEYNRFTKHMGTLTFLCLPSPYFHKPVLYAGLCLAALVSSYVSITKSALRAADLDCVLRQGVGWSSRWAAVISLAAPIAPLSPEYCSTAVPLPANRGAVLQFLCLSVGVLCCSASACQYWSCAH